MKLTILEGSLDETGRLELQRRQERGEKIRYQEFWNWLCQKYEEDTQLAIKEELKNLKHRCDGKLTLGAWREFEARFKLLYSRLEHPSADDAYALVAERMPEMMRRNCIREQDRRNQDRPTLKLKGLTNVPGIPDATREDVTRLVAATLGADERFLITADGTDLVLNKTP
eukprot:EG_transcript_26933